MDTIEVLLAGPYNLLYAGGFALAFGFAAWQGQRRGWPLLPWLTLLAACVAGGIAGSKLLHFDLHLAAPGEKTILGGLAGGMLALLIAQRFLRVHAPTWGVLAPAALLGFALGRVGCFLAGCCFGQPTELPWGVRYAVGTRPFDAQAAAGLIDAAATASLPVHPTQLYEAILALLLATLLWHWGMWLRSRGAAALALAAGYGAVRFSIEFYRAGGAEALVYGLKPVQWTVGLVTLTAALALLLREFRATAGTSQHDRREPHFAAPAPSEVARASLLVGVLLVAGIVGNLWLTPLEHIVWLAGLAPAAVGLIMQAQFRWATAPSGIVAALVLGPVGLDTVPGYELPRPYVTIGAGGTTGEYVESCGSARRYRVGGISAAYTQFVEPTTSYTLRGQVFVGNDRAADLPSGVFSPDTTLDLLGVGAHGQVDWRWFGLGLGFLAGDLVIDGSRAESVLPAIVLRVGPRDRLFVEGRLLDAEPAPVPAPVIRIGLGFPLDPGGSVLRAGVSGSGFFGSATLVTRAGTEIEPFAAYGDASTYQIALTLRQRFGPGARQPAR